MLALIAALALAQPDAGSPQKLSALDTLQAQVGAWNRGDLDAFCAVYTDDAAFVSPKGVTRGRAEVLARYKKRYPDAKAMGKLTLTPVDVQDGGEVVSVAARWELSYDDRPTAAGHTVVVLKRFGGSWRIVHDASM